MMKTKVAFQSEQSNPVLFVLIGWAERYDGTEKVRGGHKYLQTHPGDNTEAKTFVRERGGYYQCGVGRGKINEAKLDVVFVARDNDLNYRVVALYKDATASDDGDWSIAKSKHVTLYNVGERPHCAWTEGQGMRRWAHRVHGHGRVHKVLWDSYTELSSVLDKAHLGADQTIPQSYTGRSRDQPSPSPTLEERAMQFANAAVRPEQAAFRSRVFVACKGRCIISGCDVAKALDAAHRHGRNWRQGHNAAADGFLLRKDLHSLYDAKLIEITPEHMIEVDPAIATHYGVFAGKRASLRFPHA
jgi:hypothetical protein